MRIRSFLVGIALIGLASGTTGRALSIDFHGTAQVGGRPAANVVVWVDAPDATAGSQSRKVVLDQHNLSFSPRVLIVRVGTTVEFPNSDRVFHNVFSFRDGKQFDLGMYPVGTARRVRFDQPGLSRIFCNIHPGMAAYVMAVDTPYFAVSDQTGTFRIASIPPGTHTYHAWRSGGQGVNGTWTSDSDGSVELRWP